MSEMNAVLVRYGELFLKSEPVMRRYVNTLVGNLHVALEARGLDHHIDVYRGRILIRGDDLTAIADVASRIFGIVGVSPCTRTESDRERIEAAAVDLAQQSLRPGMSFAVRARRSGMKGFTSQELGKSVGSRIFNHIPDLKVDLRHPDYEVFVEARDIGGIIYDERIEGPGGLPLGTQGNVLSLLSAGIDSPVASWLVMRRGCRLTHLHFDGGSWYGGDVWDAAKENHCQLSRWTPGRSLTLIRISLEAFYEALEKIERIKNRCLICKRFMIRIGGEVAEAEGAVALVTGENIGQVASQTLVNMGVIAEANRSALPILHPLITYDKKETVDLARMIGTFRDSQGDLGCRAVPRHPAVAATLESVRADEEEMDLEGLAEKVRATTRVYRALNGEMREVS